MRSRAPRIVVSAAAMLALAGCSGSPSAGSEASRQRAIAEIHKQVDLYAQDVRAASRGVVPPDSTLDSLGTPHSVWVLQIDRSDQLALTIKAVQSYGADFGAVTETECFRLVITGAGTPTVDSSSEPLAQCPASNRTPQPASS